RHCAPVVCTFMLFSNDTPPTKIYTLSLHDALPIFDLAKRRDVDELLDVADPVHAIEEVARRWGERHRADGRAIDGEHGPDAVLEELRAKLRQQPLLGGFAERPRVLHRDLSRGGLEDLQGALGIPLGERLAGQGEG